MNEAETIQAALSLGRSQLEAISETASLDTQVLLAHLLDRSRAWVLAHPENPLSEKLQRDYMRALNRLSAGEPLPYVLGFWDFYGRRFKVDPRVLIPRPETEGLIELGLEYIDRQDQPCTILDVGTGTGCIAITLASERSSVRVIATDRSSAALTLARENACELAVAEQIHWVQCDLINPFRVHADLILANLPYIPSARLGRLPVVAYEPRIALDGGETGMDLIKKLIVQLKGRLSMTGKAVFEVDESHAAAVIAYMKGVFPTARVQLHTDLSRRDRYVMLDMGASI